MAEYTVTLSTEENLALIYWLEEVNSSRTREQNDNGESLPSIEAEQFIRYLIREDLINKARELRGKTQDLFDALKGVSAPARNAVLATIADGPRKQWLIGRLNRGE